MATSPDDLLLADALVGQLEPYLASGAVFRPVVVEAAGNATTTLTLGNLLDALERLHRAGAALGPDGTTRLADVERRFDAIRSAQSAAYGSKLSHELKGHLDSWRYYLDDCEKGDDDCAANYRREVSKRTRIHQLLAEGARQGVDVAEARGRAEKLDAQLRQWFTAGSYVGPAGEEGRFPAGTFWWLHGKVAR